MSAAMLTLPRPLPSDLPLATRAKAWHCWGIMIDSRYTSPQCRSQAPCNAAEGQYNVPNQAEPQCCWLCLMQNWHSIIKKSKDAASPGSLRALGTSRRHSTPPAAQAGRRSGAAHTAAEEDTGLPSAELEIRLDWANSLPQSARKVRTSHTESPR